VPHFPEQYAVVKVQEHGFYKFKKLHELFEDAKAEAMRLAQLEQGQFLVMKVVGYAQPSAPPALWSEA
jgi:hypothetical protein